MCINNFTTSNQSTPPDTAMKRVRQAIGNEPKKVFMLSTSESSLEASEMYCDTAFRKTTEKENITKMSTSTPHKSMALQFMMATVKTRSLRIREANLMSLNMRRERMTLMSRSKRRKLGLNPMAIRNISAIERATTKESNAFHFQSSPVKKRHSRDTIRRSNSMRNKQLNVRSVTVNHGDRSTSEYWPIPWFSKALIELFTERSLIIPINRALVTIKVTVAN
mmetsp:Transcript_46510/g.123516  ORF Transcript_46510/g.123516 Transcript_46510/m.123516 type:complete len:222 (-) Transcript_46510:1033-1698(-)